MKDVRNIIIFGYGHFGRQLYKHLAVVGHSIKVLSTVEEFIQRGAEEGVAVEKINIKRNDDILKLHIDEKRDLIYCAMNHTANNLFVVLTLRTLYPKAQIIAISNSFENTRKLKYAGANSVIDLYEATSRRVVNALTKPAVTRALDEIIYKQNDIQMAEILIPEKSFLDGLYVDEVDFKAMGVIVVAIIDKELGHELLFRDHRVNHKLDYGDTLVVVAKKEHMQKFKDKLRN